MDPPFQALIAAVVMFIFISSLFALILVCRHPPNLNPPIPLIHSQTSLPLFRSPSVDESASFDPSLHQISMSELAAATKNFAADRIVGDGSFGFVYKALLPSGATVAVKRLSADAFHGFREFRAEMETLGRIRHPNLARLLGYCISNSDRVLIYEFIENGSLDQWLYDSPPPGSDPLSWSTRIRIIKGVAAGLAFLHEECRPCIIHRDIKASNVLLDGEFGVRIADFGLARRVDSAKSHVSTQVAGTMGYMPPEYREGVTSATVKADVYSFGILMFEVAGGRRPNLTVKGEDGKEVSAVRWARGLVGAGRGMEIVDPAAVGREGLDERMVGGFLGVANRCTEELARDRPTMGEVVSLLESVS